LEFVHGFKIDISEKNSFWESLALFWMDGHSLAAGSFGEFYSLLILLPLSPKLLNWMLKFPKINFLLTKNKSSNGNTVRLAL
jgi:hypothetical protein